MCRLTRKGCTARCTPAEASNYESRFYRRVDLVAVNDIFLVEELGGEVQEHVDAGDEVLVPAHVLRQPVAQDGRGRREHRIVRRHEEHGLRDVRRAAERELPVQREVPKDAQGQCDEIGGPIRPVQQLVQQGETADFDESGAGGKEDELQESPGLVHGRSGFSGTKLGKNALGFPRLFRNFGKTNVKL